MSAPEKGKFSTDISDDVLREAMKSVERHTGQPEEGVAVDVEQPAAQAEATPEAEASGPDQAAPASPEAQELELLRAQLELSMAKGRELMEKLKDTHERMLRSAADLDNFKKRAAKEREELQKFGSEKLLKDFLPVIDNLERALEHANANTDFESLKTGVAMTRKLFEDALGRHGVKGFSSVGQPFDPRLHEAMQQVETAEVPPNHVALELVRGYMLNERLIRPALVSVAKAPPAGQAAEGGTEPA